MNLAPLIAEVNAACRAAAQRHPEVAGELDAILAALGRAQPSGAASAGAAPAQVERSLATAVGLARGRPTESLARALAACAPSLPWFSRREETAPPALQAFQAGYAYAVLVGTPRDGVAPPLASPEIQLGFALQGRDTFYPPHAHRAVEIYGILGGSAEWLRGDVWTARSAGEFFRHDSNQSHAMRTRGEPMLTLWAWTTGLVPAAPGTAAPRVGLMANGVAAKKER